MDPFLSSFVREATGARVVRRGERLQTLWGGYGELVRLHLEGADRPTVILKAVAPPHEGTRRTESAQRSHARKCRSYDVEVAFYQSHARRTNDACRVPTPLAAVASTEGRDPRWLILMEDLDGAGFPLRRRGRDARELAPCVRWLAAFHACFLGVEPTHLWPTGTYWHLATRPDELARLPHARRREHLELHAAAPHLDLALNSARFQTFVHGDAKPANFCFSPFASNGSAVAAVDFQYVGGGCGVKDLAYLLHGSLTGREVDAFIDSYFAELTAALSARDVDCVALEREWRGLYPVACSDFERFLAGWNPGM